MPVASAILMVRPAAFGYNPETAANNFFQQIDNNATDAELQQNALMEFDNMVNILRAQNLEVIVIEDNEDPPKPDAIFPNNWISTFPDGRLAIYPMYAPSRRAEKRLEIIEQLKKRYQVNLQDWSRFEEEGRFLEGTGSMVIDHEHQMIYSCISERTNISVLEKFAVANKYQAIVFLATDKEGRAIYHTNVMMTLGEKFCVLCEESFEEEWELIAVRELLDATNHAIIPISREQMECFAGNMIELQDQEGNHYLLLSETAFKSLRKEQKEMLEAFAELLPVPVPTIERIEGGSVRCMVAEIFLPRISETIRAEHK
ncbi:MAG TPA: arginine deiminase-related protein [Allocoleopsis sp.]